MLLLILMCLCANPQHCYSRLEWEQLLEQHRTLQDSFDQLQAEAKFEADQAGQQLHDRQREIDQLKAEVTVSFCPQMWLSMTQLSLHIFFQSISTFSVNFFLHF